MVFMQALSRVPAIMHGLYDEAYGHYMAALDVFMYLIKCKSTS